MKIQSLLLALVAIAVVACSGSGPSRSPDRTAGATVAPTTAPSVTSTPGPAPTLTFTWPDGEAPVVTRALTGVDERYINPGAVIASDGVLHMYPNVFTNWPGDVTTAHLTSTDGIDWVLAQDEPALVSDDIPFARPGHDVSTGFVAADGTWVLVFETVESSAPWRIGIATAPGPEGPWTVAPEAVVQPGLDGDWDAGGVQWPSVVATDDGYAMVYAGFDRPRGTGAIGLATSTDGLAWTKHDGPVLVGEQDWELGGLDRPRVARTDDGLVMVYADRGLNGRGVAWSSDGIDWRRAGTGPSFDADDLPVNGRAWDAALVRVGDDLHYYLEIGSVGTSGTEVYRAVAPLP